MSVRDQDRSAKLRLGLRSRCTTAAVFVVGFYLLIHLFLLLKHLSQYLVSQIKRTAPQIEDYPVSVVDMTINIVLTDADTIALAFVSA